MTVEGISATLCAHELAMGYRVEMPIVEQLYQVLQGNCDAHNRHCQPNGAARSGGAGQTLELLSLFCARHNLVSFWKGVFW